MSATNGTTNGDPKRILSLEASRAAKVRKGNDFITVQQAYDMVIQECAKVHEFYLEQLPPFVARMVQDALMTYGLIVPAADADIAPKATVEAPMPSENAGEGAAHDTIAPPEAAE